MANKVVLITGVGAVRGLGAALGRTFADAGYTVVLAGRNADKLRAAANDIGERGGGALAEVGDATSQADVARFVARAEEAGPLAVAIHNPGGNRPAAFLDVAPADFEEHWRAHALGGFLLAQAALPAMLARVKEALSSSPARPALCAAAPGSHPFRPPRPRCA